MVDSRQRIHTRVNSKIPCAIRFDRRAALKTCFAGVIAPTLLSGRSQCECCDFPKEGPARIFDSPLREKIRCLLNSHSFGRFQGGYASDFAAWLTGQIGIPCTSSNSCSQTAIGTVSRCDCENLYEALELLCRESNLTWALRNRSIHFTTHDDRTLLELDQPYDVSVLQRYVDNQTIADAVTLHLARAYSHLFSTPELRFREGTLYVSANPSLHRLIERLLCSMRIAAVQSAHSCYRRPVSLWGNCVMRHEQAGIAWLRKKEKLKPETISSTQLVSNINRLSSRQIRLDETGWKSVGIAPDEPIRVKGGLQSFESMLKQLTTGSSLDFCPIGRGTVVSSAGVIAEIVDSRVYFTSDLIENCCEASYLRFVESMQQKCNIQWLFHDDGPVSNPMPFHTLAAVLITLDGKGHEKIESYLREIRKSQD